jgi:hypothetical protein
MTTFKALVVSGLLLCASCATDSRRVPSPEFLGEAQEDCNFQDIPGIRFQLRSATEQAHMSMSGHLLASAIGVHQFHGVAFCRLDSPTNCRTVDGQLELQRLSWSKVTGRMSLASDPPGTWRSFVLQVTRLGDAVCG